MILGNWSHDKSLGIILLLYLVVPTLSNSFYTFNSSFYQFHIAIFFSRGSRFLTQMYIRSDLLHMPCIISSGVLAWCMCGVGWGEGALPFMTMKLRGAKMNFHMHWGAEGIRVLCQWIKSFKKSLLLDIWKYVMFLNQFSCQYKTFSIHSHEVAFM